MAKKPNKYTRLVRYMIQTIVNDKYQAPYIDKLINGEWKEFFETVEKALQSVEEEDNVMIQHNRKETMFEKISKVPEGYKKIFNDLINEEIFTVDKYIQTCKDYKEETKRADEIAEALMYKEFLIDLIKED